MTGTAAMIEDLGHTSIEALSAAEALAKLDAGVEVDVVITDYAMPSMTGLQLAECIRDRFPGLPIILVTGYAEVPADPVKQGLLKLTKPCTQQEIAAAIHLAMRSGSPVKELAAPAAARG
jgi:CheY-like chemotaxis protein